MPSKRKRKGDVQWLIPNKKKPIAHSPRAVSDFIVIMAQEYDTIQEIYNAINYDYEAKEILRMYIDKGYGVVVARDIFK